MLQSKDEIKQRWTQYCSSLYKNHGGGDQMVKELEEITPPNDEDPKDILCTPKSRERFARSNATKVLAQME